MTDTLPERIRKVPCPACGADAGAHCLGIYGRPIRDTHVDRRMAAKRAGFVAVTKGGIFP